ncbi:MAG: ATP-grasp domain-containing protein [Myxococcales bacterium]|nr:ATP-grasp domain-containing protein [Myxococcales bacterium]MCB9691346.1 ATP-grasp domain-containing protein [Alphaproteobacteria bacterium]MCB9695121.1 ATP-grasp domain-containing protein [Alphaproteobacteria bacterium]
MPHVLFVAPHFPANQRRFVRGLKNVGAVVTGLGDMDPRYLDSELRELLDFYEHVPNLANEEMLYEGVRNAQRRGPWVDRLEATIEVHMNVTARVRQRCGIPGMTPDQVNLCRDKFEMKRFLRERGIPCARNAEVSTAEQARAFVADVGFPVILKPRDGAGAHGTHKITNEAELESALREEGFEHGQRWFTMETFVTGHEGFFDTLTVDGQVVFEAVTHYYPNVLEAMRTRWISPQMVTTNRIDAPGYGELRHFGRRVIEEMGLRDTATHMEWFAGDQGLVFSEIGARPPGCNFWDLYCEANDMDLYTEWARAVVWGKVEQRPSRRHAAGLIALRPSQDGHIVGYTGVERMQSLYGDLIFKCVLPPPGHRTNPVEAGYLANAYVAVRHPDYDVVRRVLTDIGETVKVIAR